jgi:hypothetical protein
MKVLSLLFSDWEWEIYRGQSAKVLCQTRSSRTLEQGGLLFTLSLIIKGATSQT